MKNKYYRVINKGSGVLNITEDDLNEIGGTIEINGFVSGITYDKNEVVSKVIKKNDFTFKSITDGNTIEPTFPLYEINNWLEINYSGTSLSTPTLFEYDTTYNTGDILLINIVGVYSNYLFFGKPNLIVINSDGVNISSAEATDFINTLLYHSTNGREGTNLYSEFSFSASTNIGPSGDLLADILIPTLVSGFNQSMPRVYMGEYDSTINYPIDIYGELTLFTEIELNKYGAGSYTQRTKVPLFFYNGKFYEFKGLKDSTDGIIYMPAPPDYVVEESNWKIVANQNAVPYNNAKEGVNLGEYGIQAKRINGVDITLSSTYFIGDVPNLLVGLDNIKVDFTLPENTGNIVLGSLNGYSNTIITAENKYNIYEKNVLFGKNNISLNTNLRQETYYQDNEFDRVRNTIVGTDNISGYLANIGNNSIFGNYNFNNPLDNFLSGSPITQNTIFGNSNFSNSISNSLNTVLGFANCQGSNEVTNNLILGNGNLPFSRGSYNIAIGSNSSKYSTHETTLTIGNDINQTFVPNTSKVLTILDTTNDVDVSANTITIIGHGIIDAYVYFQVGTTINVPNLPNTSKVLGKIIDVNTIKLEVNNGVLYFKNAAGVITLTPHVDISESIAIGYGSQNTKKNQFVLGGSNITEVKTGGLYLGAGYSIPSGTSDDVLLGDGSTTSLSGIAGGGVLPPTLETGTTINLSNYIVGKIYNYDSPSTASNFTTTDLVIGGYATNFINTVGKVAFPTLNGVNNPREGATFEVNKTFQMIITTYDGTTASYYFIKY